MSALERLAAAYPLHASVKHASTGRVGRVELCRARDRIAAQVLGPGRRAAHLILPAGLPVVWVDFGDGHPAWYVTRVLTRTAAPGTATVWHGRRRDTR